MRPSSKTASKTMASRRKLPWVLTGISIFSPKRLFRMGLKSLLTGLHCQSCKNLHSAELPANSSMKKSGKGLVEKSLL